MALQSVLSMLMNDLDDIMDMLGTLKGGSSSTTRRLFSFKEDVSLRDSTCKKKSTSLVAKQNRCAFGVLNVWSTVEASVKACQLSA